MQYEFICDTLQSSTSSNKAVTMKNLLIIDPQNDFCDIPNAALPVAGAQGDLQRLAAWVRQHIAQLDGITVTLDSHASVAVERTTFWQNKSGEAVSPFTFITSADLQSGAYAPRDRSKTLAVAAMLDQLAARGRPGLVVWPVHCVTGTWGHNIYSESHLHNYCPSRSHPSCAPKCAQSYAINGSWIKLLVQTLFAGRA
jgi:nicotinamidase-related amidase